MRTRPFALAAAAAVVASVATFAAASGTPEPKTSVALAKTWESAVEEAKALNVPIVLHNHGMFCGPCWGMHSSVMLNKKYIEFANDNTVEVIALQSLQEGIDKKDKHAETYDAKEAGKAVKYLVEFPGLTAEEMIALHGSKAGTYNQTGKIPFTALIDPYTESEITHWSGGQSVGTIEDAVTEAKKNLAKEHGKGVARKDMKILADAEEDSVAKSDKGDFAGALDVFGKVTGKAEKWPDLLKDRLKADREKVVAAATAALDKIAESKEANPAQAKKDLNAITAKLRGTGLETRAKDLLAGL